MTVGCQTSTKPSDDWFEGGSMRTASAETMQLTARILASKGKTAQAGFVLDRMARDYPDQVATYSEGAEVLMIEGRISDAINWLGRGLERLPAHPVLLNDRGMCHLVAGDLGSATADFEAAHAADPGDADFVGNLALVRALVGDEAGAAALWGRILPPADIEANLQLARKARPKFAEAQ
ncbi:MAG: tetratricopeptide repeat protein [bacterium]